MEVQRIWLEACGRGRKSNRAWFMPLWGVARIQRSLCIRGITGWLSFSLILQLICLLLFCNLSHQIKVPCLVQLVSFVSKWGESVLCAYRWSLHTLACVRWQIKVSAYNVGVMFLFYCCIVCDVIVVVLFVAALCLPFAVPLLSFYCLKVISARVSQWQERREDRQR